MRLIEWGIFRKNLKYPFFLLLFYFSRTLTKNKMENIINHSNNSNHPFLYTFYMFLGEFIGSFFMLCCEKIRTNNDNSNDSNESLKKIQIYLMDVSYINTELDNDENKISKKTIGIIFLTCLLDAISYSISITIGFFQLSIIDKKMDSEWLIENKLKIFQLIFSAFLCNKILQIQLHRHHYLSMGIIIIFEIFLISWDYFVILYNEFKTYIIIILLLIFNTFLYSFQEVLEKYLMDIKFLSINKLLLYQGIIGMFLTIIIFIILINIKCFDNFSKMNICDKDKNIESFNDIIQLLENKYFFIISIIYIFLCSGANIYKLQTNKMMTPMHRTIADSAVMPVYVLIYYPKSELKVLIITLIISFLILFMCFVYCEVLIIKICNLNKNTYYYIVERGNIETDNNNLIVVD